MTINEAIRRAIKQRRRQNGTTTIEIPPDSDVVEMIVANGGRVLRERYERWCRNDCCSHHTHDPGQYWTEVEVPAGWRAERPEPDVFDMDEGRETGVLIIPTTPPVGVVIRDNGHFASVSRLAPLRAHALEVLGDPACRR